MTKLDWLNGMHIRQLPLTELAQRLESENFLPGGVDQPQALEILPLVIERMTLLSEFTDKTSWFFSQPAPPPAEDLIPKKSDRDTSTAALSAAAEALQALDDFSPDTIGSCLDSVLEKGGWKKPFLFMPLRFALTSRRDSPDLLDVVSILGKDRCLERIQNSLKVLSTA